MSKRLTEHLRGEPSLIIYGIGVNDGAVHGDIEIFKNNYNAALAKFRKSELGSISKCSVVLLVPNTASDSQNNRDVEWIKSIRPIIIEAADQHQYVWIDLYGAFPNTRNAVGLWLADDLPDSSGGVHPDDIFTRQIWSFIARIMMSNGMASLLYWNAEGLRDQVRSLDQKREQVSSLSRLTSRRNGKPKKNLASFGEALWKLVRKRA